MGVEKRSASGSVPHVHLRQPLPQRCVASHGHPRISTTPTERQPDRHQRRQNPITFCDSRC